MTALIETPPPLSAAEPNGALGFLWTRILPRTTESSTTHRLPPAPGFPIRGSKRCAPLQVFLPCHVDPTSRATNLNPNPSHFQLRTMLSTTQPLGPAGPTTHSPRPSGRLSSPAVQPSHQILRFRTARRAKSMTNAKRSPDRPAMRHRKLKFHRRSENLRSPLQRFHVHESNR